jgi:hypothetical protein
MYDDAMADSAEKAFKAYLDEVASKPDVYGPSSREKEAIVRNVPAQVKELIQEIKQKEGKEIPLEEGIALLFKKQLLESWDAK